ncbi:MAG: hypothetical protein Q7R69_01760 [bacterium]|nr:hypothetical protein [bacterium]
MENLKKAEELNLALLKRYHDDALSDLMDTDDYTSIYEDEIIRKISEAIDEEIDSEYIPEWPELMTAIKNSFQFETSMPLSKAFDPQRIIERHKERNREYIKK